MFVFKKLGVESISKSAKRKKDFLNLRQVMTTAKRKKVITIETFQRTVIRQNEHQPQILWCEFCQAEVEMTTPELAANILGVTVREIYRRLEQGDLHFFETEPGEVFICTNSLKPKQRGEI